MSKDKNKQVVTSAKITSMEIGPCGQEAHEYEMNFKTSTLIHRRDGVQVEVLLGDEARRRFNKLVK